MSVEQEIPEGFEKMEHHDSLTLHDKERGIIISTHKRDRVEVDILGKFPWRVIAAQNQKGWYDGVFDSQSHAEDKAFELAGET